jgi:hypothetical protein
MAEETTLDLGRAAAYVQALTDAVRRALACEPDQRRLIPLPPDFPPAFAGKPSGCPNQRPAVCFAPPGPPPGGGVTIGQLVDILTGVVRVADVMHKGLGGGGVTGGDVADIGSIIAPQLR